MRRALVVALSLFAPVVQAQPALLDSAIAAMGADKLATLRYTATGGGASFGQAYKPGMHWPKLAYSSYTREIDYRASASSEVVMRRRAEPTGGGAVPLEGEARAGAVVSGEHAWNLAAGPAATPRQAARAERLHDIWITPHGALQAARRFAAPGEGIRFAVPGVMTARVFLDAQNLVQRVESRYTDNVLGDIDVVTDYWDYRDLGGVKFPMRMRQARAGSETLDIEVKEVQPNAAVDIAVPENVRAATERVAAEKAAEGVWFLAGGSHNSVAIEMQDHVVLVEAPLYDGRVAAVLAEVAKLAPGKPVRYVVNSHAHFDHAGGLRAAVAAGAAVIAHRESKAYYEKAFASPARITPDLLAKSGRQAKVIGVASRHVLKDARRTVEIHHLRDPLHTGTYLMVYLPKERLLIEADAYTPAPPGAAAPAKPSPSHVNLVENLQRLKLRPERILPLHGRIVPAAELYGAAGRAL
jgi:glyoxylase-like metal-dependent hydrolase (beta-lactamase superfamily II)